MPCLVAPAAADDAPGYSPEALACYAAAAAQSPATAERCRAPASAGEPHALYLLAERVESPRRLELLRRAARADYPPALVALGDALRERARVFEAERLYFRAAELDYGPGMQRAAEVLLSDARRAEDFEPIRLMLRAPALDGYGDAAYDLALMYRDGIGGAVDRQAARHWMFEAATTGHAQAQYETAMAFMHDDPGQALRWLVKAARAGMAEAMFELAAVHTDGVATPQNLDEALYWAHQAVRAGHPGANRLLEEIRWRRDNPGIKRSAFHLTPHDEDGAIEEVLPAPARRQRDAAADTPAEGSRAAPKPPPRRTSADTDAEAPYIVDWQIELNTGQEK